MSDAWRLFIAIELPEETLAAIERLQADLKRAIPARSARWTRLERIHLTLKFLGDVPSGQAEAVMTGVRNAAAGHSPFGLTVEGLGCFPDVRRPRVLWAGVAGEMAALRRLHASVERHITPLGYPAEERGFNPHLTLARAAQGASRNDLALVSRVTVERDVGQLAAWRVEEVSLIRSHLERNGPRYEQVTSVKLA